jgi:hypothetical protein
MDVQAFFPAFSLSRLFRGFFDGFFEELWKLWMSRLFLLDMDVPAFFSALAFLSLDMDVPAFRGYGCPGFSGFSAFPAFVKEFGRSARLTSACSIAP